MNLFQEASHNRAAEYEARTRLPIEDYRTLINSSIKKVQRKEHGAAYRHHCLIEDFKRIFPAAVRNQLAREWYGKND